MKKLPRIAGLVAGLFFALPAYATTFGPITVYEQATHTGYVVRGRVTGGPTPYMETTYQKPFTQWTVDVTDQPVGKPLGSRITIREPGGEIGDTGYHVAASAEFSVGEDIFVALHDTDEPGVEEVTGLASGKYLVQLQPNGKELVVSGLGVAISGPGGMLSPEDFSALLHRIGHGQATAADKDIWVTKMSASHAHDEKPELEALARKVFAPPNRGPADPVPVTVSGQRQSPQNPLSLKENSSQESPAKADEGSTGFSSWAWVLGLAVLVGLLFGFFALLRR